MIKYKVKSKKVKNLRHKGIRINRIYQGVVEILNWQGTKLYSLTSPSKRINFDDAINDAKQIMG